MSPVRLMHLASSTGQATMLLLLPHGGQRLARRNAWASMSADATRARARLEAAAALALASAAGAAAG